MTSLAGFFLVAKPALTDPNFRQTVVLLLGHEEGGAFGVVVNRPEPSSPLSVPLYQGGPCGGPGLILLHGFADLADSSTDLEDEAQREVAPGVFIGDASCLKQLAQVDKAARRVRAYRGYAGWGPDQLEREIAVGAWALVPASAELLFDIPSDELWVRLVPNRIPEPSLN